MLYKRDVRAPCPCCCTVPCGHLASRPCRPSRTHAPPAEATGGVEIERRRLAHPRPAGRAEPSVASSLQDTTRPEATTGFTTSNRTARCSLPFASCRRETPTPNRTGHHLLFVFRSLFYTCVTAPLRGAKRSTTPPPTSPDVSPSPSPAGTSRHNYRLPLVKTKLRCLNLKPHDTGPTGHVHDWPRRRRPPVWSNSGRLRLLPPLVMRPPSTRTWDTHWNFWEVVVRLKPAAAMHVWSVMVSV
jgi:hypothetical protein